MRSLRRGVQPGSPAGCCGSSASAATTGIVPRIQQPIRALSRRADDSTVTGAPPRDDTLCIQGCIRPAAPLSIMSRSFRIRNVAQPQAGRQAETRQFHRHNTRPDSGGRSGWCWAGLRGKRGHARGASCEGGVALWVARTWPRIVRDDGAPRARSSGPTWACATAGSSRARAYSRRGHWLPHRRVQGDPLCRRPPASGRARP